MNDILYTMPEIAQLLKTNVDYVHKLRKSGVLKCIKLGSYKVRKAELERFLADNEGKDLTDPFKVSRLNDAVEQ